MDYLFDWREYTSKSENTKKKKYDETVDGYWYDLFKNYMIFPVVDTNRSEIQTLASGNYADIAKIQDVQKLKEIIFHMKDLQDSGDGNEEFTDSYEYKCERISSINGSFQQNYLQLAIVLTVINNGRQFSYFDDFVSITLGKYIKDDSDDSDDDPETEEFICSLPTFCMLILYPSALDKIEMDETDDYALRVAPYFKDDVNAKDCCFFTKLDDEYDEHQRANFGRDMIVISKECEDDEGLIWCPSFFNAGSKLYTYKIKAYYYRGAKSLTVKKYETFEYL